MILCFGCISCKYSINSAHSIKKSFCSILSTAVTAESLDVIAGCPSQPPYVNSQNRNPHPPPRSQPLHTPPNPHRHPLPTHLPTNTILIPLHHTNHPKPSPPTSSLTPTTAKPSTHKKCPPPPPNPSPPATSTPPAPRPQSPKPNKHHPSTATTPPPRQRQRHRRRRTKRAPTSRRAWNTTARCCRADWKRTSESSRVMPFPPQSSIRDVPTWRRGEGEETRSNDS